MSNKDDQDFKSLQFLSMGHTLGEVRVMDTFRLFLKCTFGEDFYWGIIKEGSDLFMLTPTQPAIAFKELGFDFVLSQINSNWQLTIKHDRQDFITNIVKVPDIAQPGDMVLTFHSLKAEMIVELQQYIAQTKGRTFEDHLRDERNKEVLPPDPSLLLPNTMIRLTDWECQLILEFVRSGLDPAPAITKAKHLIWLQLNSPGGEPGDLSIIDKCKSRLDQR